MFITREIMSNVQNKYSSQCLEDETYFQKSVPLAVFVETHNPAVDVKFCASFNFLSYSLTLNMNRTIFFFMEHITKHNIYFIFIYSIFYLSAFIYSY